VLSEQLTSRFALPVNSTVPGPTVCQWHRSNGIAFLDRVGDFDGEAHPVGAAPGDLRHVVAIPPEPVAVHATTVNADLGCVTCSPLPPTPASRCLT
jgi:hypothetical protein